MEKKKNRKKLFAIITGSMMAFVLTVVLSVTITIAYFGQNMDETPTLRMDGSIEIDSISTDIDNPSVGYDNGTMDLKNVLPGQKINPYIACRLKTNAKSDGDGEDTTQTAFLKCIVTITSDAEDADGNKYNLADLKFAFKLDANWIKDSSVEFGNVSGDSSTQTTHYYYVDDATAASNDDAKMLPIVLDSTVTDLSGAQEIKFSTQSFNLSTDLKNSVSNATVTIKITFIAIQTGIPANINESGEYDSSMGEDETDKGFVREPNITQANRVFDVVGVEGTTPENGGYDKPSPDVTVTP